MKKDFEEDVNLKPKRKNKSVFLRDIYTSAPQISALPNNVVSNWEALTTDKQN